MKSANVYEALYQYTKALAVALGYKDMMTRLHSERVRDISLMMGNKLDIDAEEMSALKVASSFHDIGKIGIPDNILLKPSKLNDAEWVEMKKHSEYGEGIITSSGFKGCKRAAAAIRHHHEYFGGGGYPDGLRGESIPICSRIIALADSYDAMAITRVYHRARNHKEIMEVMHGERGSKFEPRLFDIFVQSIEASAYRIA